MLCFRSALLEQMPLMEVNRNKSDLTNGEAEGEDILLDTNSTQTVDKTNVENKKAPTTTTEV